MVNASYEYLPHTTDAFIEARGATLERAFESAGLALFDTMCNVKSISHKLTDQLEFSGKDEISLLYDWLESLLLKFDLDEKVYSRFEVSPVMKSETMMKAKAHVSGEKYDRNKHGAKVEVKAVTYHKMEIRKADSGTVLRFILDL